MDNISAESMAVVDQHLKAMGTRNIDTILSHYAEDAVVATTFTEKPCVGWAELRPFIEHFVVNTPGELDGTKTMNFTRKEAIGEFVYLVFENDQMQGTETYVVRDGRIAFESSTVYMK